MKLYSNFKNILEDFRIFKQFFKLEIFEENLLKICINFRKINI